MILLGLVAIKYTILELSRNYVLISYSCIHGIYENQSYISNLNIV